MIPAAPPRQRGLAVWLLLSALLTASAYLYSRQALHAGGRLDRQTRLATALARAKEALIARAVADDNRPGSLPCPDLATNEPLLANLPGDGKNDLFTMTHCPSYVGWLPWVTLDLPETLDTDGNRLWYVLDPALRDDDSAQPINSETALRLRLDGQGDIAALIIAPGPPLPAQNRPSLRPADYLDGDNGDGDDHVYVSGPVGETFNDIVLPITRTELMAAVEQRIANAVRHCLDEHARHPDNALRSWPWPAPLSNASFKGRTGSLFGQLPSTQPGNPESALKEANSRVAGLAVQLQAAATPDSRSSVLLQLEAEATILLALYDRLQSASKALESSARTTQAAFQSLDDLLAAATQNSGTWQNAAASAPGAINTAMAQLPGFREALKDSGFDIFLMAHEGNASELNARLSACRTTPNATTLGKLATPVNEYRNRLLVYVWTPSPAIASAIASARQLAATAGEEINTARQTLAAVDIADALESTQALERATRTLAATIGASRLPASADEFLWHAQDIALRHQEFGNSPTPENRADLTASLEASRHRLDSLTSALTNTTAGMRSAREMLDNALAATAGGSNAEIETSVDAASTSLARLADDIARNGDNVAAETLGWAANTLSTAAASPPATLTAARAVRTPAKAIVYWSGLAAAQAADIARLARRGTTAQEDSDASAYTAARLLRQSLRLSLERIQTYRNNPSDKTRADAEQALTDTQARLATLQARSAQLDAQLKTAMAEGVVPTRWHGTSCTPFAPGGDGWWHANRWQETLFYQLASRITTGQGKLRINGLGGFRLVVAASGRPLAAQARHTRRIEAYLEGANADPSRNGDALAPSTDFIRRGAAPDFNDRLAY